MFSLSRKIPFFIVLAALTTASVSACSTQRESNDLHMMSMDRMPAEVQSAPLTVQEAYQFTAANPDLVQNIPCYCGCGGIGHTSNYDCYVSSTDDKGGITSFDNHALGCSICVDITQDVMRLTREGKSPQEARAYIDAAYSKYGPSNIP